MLPIGTSNNLKIARVKVFYSLRAIALDVKTYTNLKENAMILMVLFTEHLFLIFY